MPTTTPSDALTEEWRARLARSPHLQKHISTLVEEELTPALLSSMADMTAALAELGLDGAESDAMCQALSTSDAAAEDVSDDVSATQHTVNVADPLLTLRSPPCGWPESAARTTSFVSTSLRGTKMRLVGEPSSQHAAPLVGVTLRPHDAKGNAMRVRDRTGWAVIGGYILFERAEADGHAVSTAGTRAVPGGDGGQAAQATAAAQDGLPADSLSWSDGDGGYVAVPHYWNVTPRGLWLDATPRAHAHLATLVLIEAAVRVPAPPPPYAAQPANPLVIVAVEGMCNRLRAITSYRLVAHESGRPLVVVWRRDEYCNGHFHDVFLSIPGVSFVKSPPGGKPLSSCTLADDTHPAVKGTRSEALCTPRAHPRTHAPPGQGR